MSAAFKPLGTVNESFVSPSNIPLKFHKSASSCHELIHRLLSQAMKTEDGRLFIPVETVLAYLSKDSLKSRLIKPQGSPFPPLSPDEVDSLGGRSVVKDLSRPSSGKLKLSKVHDRDSRGQVVFSSKFYSEDLKVDDVPELKLSINELAVDDTFVLKHIKFKLVQPQCVLKETLVAKSSTPTYVHKHQQSAPACQLFACPPAPSNLSPVAGPRCLSFHSHDSRHVSTQQDWN